MDILQELPIEKDNDLYYTRLRKGIIVYSYTKREDYYNVVKYNNTCHYLYSFPMGIKLCIHSFLKNKRLATTQEQLKELFDEYIYDRNNILRSYCIINEYKLIDILNSENKNNIIGLNTIADINHISDAIRYHDNSNSISLPDFKEFKEFKQSILTMDTNIIQTQIKDIDNCYYESLNNLSNSIQFFRYFSNNVKNSCPFCKDQQRVLQTHREYLKELQTIYCYRNNDLIVTSIKPFESKELYEFSGDRVQSTKYEKLLFIAPDHRFPTMNDTDMSNIRYNGNGLFASSSMKLTHYGALSYYELYKIDINKSKQLYEFLNCVCYSAKYYAYSKYGSDFVFANLDPSELYYSPTDNRPNRIYLWVHAYVNTIQHLHIHVLIVNSSETFIPSNIKNDIFNYQNTYFYDDKKTIINNGPYPQKLNIFTFCKACTGMSIDSQLMNRYNYLYMDLTKIPNYIIILKNEKFRLLKCKSIIYDRVLENYYRNNVFLDYNSLPDQKLINNSYNIKTTIKAFQLLKRHKINHNYIVYQDNKFNTFVYITDSTGLVDIYNDPLIPNIKNENTLKVHLFTIFMESANQYVNDGIVAGRLKEVYMTRQSKGEESNIINEFTTVFSNIYGYDPKYTDTELNNMKSIIQLYKNN